MLYKYHLAILKEDKIICDRYYMDGQKPDNEELKNLVKQFDADEMYMNTVEDNELESFNKEKIDIESL